MVIVPIKKVVTVSVKTTIPMSKLTHKQYVEIQGGDLSEKSTSDSAFELKPIGKIESPNSAIKHTNDKRNRRVAKKKSSDIESKCVMCVHLDQVVDLQQMNYVCFAIA